MAKVWDKGGQNKLHPLIEAYNVGEDHKFDGKLFKYELAASSAHAIALNKIGILTNDELESIFTQINDLYKKHGDEITLKMEDEDIHSKLENMLTEKLGETGKKIHTGRSRNDQVITVTRLYEKEQIIETGLLYIEFLLTLGDFAEKEGDKILPGYTHTKQAMLMTVKMWICAFIESGLDNLSSLFHILTLVDSNPLGSGSGFGVPLPLDRELTAKLLGFSRVLENPIYVQNSRGKLESSIIDSFWLIMNDFSRISSDLLFFNSDELGYVKTNDTVTTGSSIMPQKRNFDIMELIRAKTNVMASYSATIKNIVTGLISGYHRDLQETKEPLFKSIDLIKSTIKVMNVVFKNISFDETAVKQNLTKGIFATDIAFKAVEKGVPFREAYKQAGKQINDIEINEEIIRDSIKRRVSKGSHITIDLKKYHHSIEIFSNELKGKMEKMGGIFQNLLIEGNKSDKPR